MPWPNFFIEKIFRKCKGCLGDLFEILIRKFKDKLLLI